tara:strand:+ start:197 stop:676 length:480 start_codon:yes stop_codon:yes gene_type:complete
MENTTEDQAGQKSSFKRKWRNFLIYPRYQLAILIGHLLILAGGFVIIYYQVQSSFFQLDEVASAKNILASPHYKELVLYQENFILTTIFSTMIYCFVVAALFSIVFTHKSAGAIYGLKKYLTDVAEKGWKRPLTFRKNDLHQELPEILNAAIDRIKKDK